MSVPQSLGMVKGTSRLDAFEPPFLRTGEYPQASPAGPVPVSGPVLVVCVHHDADEGCWHGASSLLLRFPRFVPYADGTASVFTRPVPTR